MYCIGMRDNGKPENPESAPFSLLPLSHWSIQFNGGGLGGGRVAALAPAGRCPMLASYRVSEMAWLSARYPHYAEAVRGSWLERVRYWITGLHWLA